MKIVEVTWGDAHGRAGWRKLKHKPEVIRTLGYLLKEDEVGISLAMDKDAKGEGYGSPAFIPRGMIMNVEVLKEIE